MEDNSFSSCCPITSCFGGAVPIGLMSDVGVEAAVPEEAVVIPGAEGDGEDGVGSSSPDAFLRALIQLLRIPAVTAEST